MNLTNAITHQIELLQSELAMKTPSGYFIGILASILEGFQILQNRIKDPIYIVEAKFTVIPNAIYISDTTCKVFIDAAKKLQPTETIEYYPSDLNNCDCYIVNNELTVRWADTELSSTVIPTKECNFPWNEIYRNIDIHYYEMFHELYNYEPLSS